MRAAIASAALLFMIGMSAAGAQSIYKWVDANGVTHFSEQRPQGVEYERLSVRVYSGQQNQARSNQARSESTSAASRERARQEKKEQSVEDAARSEREQEIRQENCVKARERQKTYETSRRLYRELDNGEREYLSDEELDAARDESRALVKEWCD